MCLYPKIIRNRKYVVNKKNKGNVPTAKDKRVLYVPVGCGKCMECKKQKSREWQVRLGEEIRHDKSATFVTLTFSNESLEELGKDIKLKGYDKDNEIATIATRRFLERWRKKYKKSVKHWFVTEIGGKGYESIHIHGLVWTNEDKEDIRKIWRYGNVWMSHETKGGYVSERTVNYIVKYIHKTDEKHKEYESKILTSPGIGKGYFKRKDYKQNKYKKGETNEMYTNRQGIKMALPIYYRNKIYTDEEKEKLWLEKLDEKKRYVNGEEICIKDNEDDYYRVLKEARALNRKLGYGDDKINWERKKYENERRNLLYKKRKKN